ncbi:anti-sigma factor [Thalassotalea sp. ND16A]|uniref:anti-sigma factor n=1 Tax=Thalassotalea sp. ND16A TaxID=1535422 RepID=UPI00051A74E7|nr:anti-sigma factor [Thalassotalea sp. ND16A]KGJ95695.1 hypothetical protein ND16A_1230 [Thalassotalea sp. ND16A]
MLKQLNRYNRTEVIEHLASQYLLGLLPPRVHRRVEHLLCDNQALAQRIEFWQNRLITLDIHTPLLPAAKDNWQKISQQLALEDAKIADKPEASAQVIPTKQQAQKNRLNNETESLGVWQKVTKVSNQLFSMLIARRSNFSPVLSVLFILLLSYVGYQSFVGSQNKDPLSYVAVLTDHSQQAHLVASTYGESRTLIVNMIGGPEITTEQSFELWVLSKTDGEARSLGIIPDQQALIEQQLSVAQWRLIKDSHSLMVTIEEFGGSAIGEPSEQIVSRGLCVRLTEWDNNAKA